MSEQGARAAGCPVHPVGLLQGLSEPCKKLGRCWRGTGLLGGAQILNPDPTDLGLSAARRKTSREAAPRRASPICSQHKEFFMMAAMPGKPLRGFFQNWSREKKTAASGF